MAPKQWAVFTTDSKPRLGGIAEFLHGLCEQIGRSQNLTVYSTVAQASEHAGQHYRMVGLPVRPARNLGKLFGDKFLPLRKWNTFKYYRALEQLAKKEIIQARQDGAEQILIGSWSLESHFWCEACLRAQIPYVLLCHGLEWTIPLNGLPSTWRKIDLTAASQRVVNSEGTGRLLQQLAESKISYAVVHPGIEASTAVPDAAQILAQRKVLGIPDQAFVILTVGRLVARKGVDRILEALSRLKNKNIYHLICGDGPEKKDLEALAKKLGVSEQVKFVSRFDENEKKLFYAICDAFVMPNHTVGGRDWEGFGIVFLEAAAAGKPSIGGNSGGVPDVVRDGQTGILVDPDRPEELDKAILSLAQDPVKKNGFGRQARKMALEEFSWENTGVRFAAAMAGKV